jgi:hypothetical protein
VLCGSNSRSPTLNGNTNCCRRVVKDVLPSHRTFASGSIVRYNDSVLHLWAEQIQCSGTPGVGRTGVGENFGAKSSVDSKHLDSELLMSAMEDYMVKGVEGTKAPS